MKNTVSTVINKVITTAVFAVIVLYPVLFSPFFTEFYDTTKIVVLGFVSCILALLWVIKWLLQGKVTMVKTPLDLPLVILLVVIIASTLMGTNQYMSVIGNLPKVHGSAVSWLFYILFYFVAASHIRGSAMIKKLSLGLLASTSVVALLSLTSYFGLYLPFAQLQFNYFNPAGSSFSAVTLMLLILPILLLAVTRPSKFLSPIAGLVLSGLYLIAIVLIGANYSSDFWIILSPAFIAIYATVGIILFASKGKSVQKVASMLAIPMVVALVVALISYGPIDNPLKSKAQNFNREISLDIDSSWKVAASTIREAIWLGTGPGTYPFNFTVFKPAQLNATPFWSLRFDSAYNEFYQLLTTSGIFGLLALAFVAITIAIHSIKGIADSENSMSAALSISSLVGVVLLLVHTSNSVGIVALFTVFIMMLALRKNDDSAESVVGTKHIGGKFSIGFILPLLALILVLMINIMVFWNAKSLLLADYYHRMALNSASSKALDTYNYLVKAENENPKVDLYRVDLAQINFGIANSIVAAKGPTEASPAGSLTDDEKKNVQALLAQSIQEAQAATTINPRNSLNWEVLGALYRQIAGNADNALQFSLFAYGRAIQLDPMNPLLRINVGGIYYATKNYDLAARFFGDAINLKPDMANAYFNYSVALRDAGNIQGAIQAAEQVVKLLEKDNTTPDYKAASAYLADLKSRTATGSAKQSNIQAPAAQEANAKEIKNPELKNVNVPPVEKVATPAAVKKVNP